MIVAMDRFVRQVSLGTLRACLRGMGIVLGDRERLARATSTSTMVAWVAVLLTLYLLFYYATQR